MCGLQRLFFLMGIQRNVPSLFKTKLVGLDSASALVCWRVFSLDDTVIIQSWPAA
jgi:hypothetical protein